MSRPPEPVLRANVESEQRARSNRANLTVRENELSEKS